MSRHHSVRLPSPPEQITSRHSLLFFLTVQANRVADLCISPPPLITSRRVQPTHVTALPLIESAMNPFKLAYYRHQTKANTAGQHAVRSIGNWSRFTIKMQNQIMGNPGVHPGCPPTTTARIYRPERCLRQMMGNPGVHPGCPPTTTARGYRLEGCLRAVVTGNFLRCRSSPPAEPAGRIQRVEHVRLKKNTSAARTHPSRQWTPLLCLQTGLSALELRQTRGSHGIVSILTLTFRTPQLRQARGPYGVVSILTHLRLGHHKKRKETTNRTSAADDANQLS